MLGMMLVMSSIFVCAKSNTDSLLLARIWAYGAALPEQSCDTTINAYLRYTIDTRRRNPTLFLVPSMYVVARGDRSYIGETFGQLHIAKDGQFSMTPQAVAGTIPRNRRVMPTMLKYLTPNLYGKTIYQQQLLSPFHPTNRAYYRYDIGNIGTQVALIKFKPRLRNTQLISGQAYVDTRTGRIIMATIKGEYDMIGFQVQVMPNYRATRQQIPQWCSTDAKFYFMGNKIDAQFQATYNIGRNTEDSIGNRSMKDLRTMPLNKKETAIYAHFDSIHQQTDTLLTADTVKKHNRLKEIAIDIIGSRLINSFQTQAGGASIKTSPLFNPLYLSYSHSRGLSYKLKVSMQYSWNSHRYLTLTPRVGYNFKIKQFFFNAPLRMTYNPKRDGYTEITWANGNRITNSSVIDLINDGAGKVTDEVSRQLEYFNDNNLQIVNNVGLFDWLEIKTGIEIHQRTAVNKRQMAATGHPTTYRSFSPLISLQFLPWRHGPVLTANYERSIKNVLRSNLEYERWEFDASYQKRMNCMRVLNMRAGGGFYTKQKTSYFVDYSNFRDENLPNGWDDDWTGQFQLLSRNLYNASNYYLRGHISYESPFMALSWLPWVGRYIETERIYLSTLSIAHTRPYNELGYGFTTRFISIGLFASFLHAQYQEIGCKFTFELFRKW